MERLAVMLAMLLSAVTLKAQGLGCTDDACALPSPQMASVETRAESVFFIFWLFSFLANWADGVLLL